MNAGVGDFGAVKVERDELGKQLAAAVPGIDINRGYELPPEPKKEEVKKEDPKKDSYCATLAQAMGRSINTVFARQALDPKNAAKLKDCGILVVDSPTDVYASALIYLGKDPDTRDPSDWTAAADLMMKIRPFVRRLRSR